MDVALQRFALIFLLFMVCAPARADDAASYAVHGVQVDASADNAAAARDKAIAQGARKGLEQLLQNLTLADPKALPIVTDKMAGPLVLDFDVESERSSATRYIASLGFRYKPAGVQALLGQAKSLHLAQRAPLLLVVPVYRAASGDLLWQAANPWHDAWKAAADHAGLVPVVVATGTAEDQQAFTAKDLDDNAKLLDLAQHYKADNAVVVIASAISPTGDPAQGLNITLADGGGPDTSFTSAGAATPSATLDQGMTTTLTKIDALWREHVLKNTSGAIAFKTGDTPSDVASSPAVETDKFNGNMFALRAAIAGPGQWAALRARLGQMAGISHIEQKSLTRDEVIFTIGLNGDEDRLAHVLADGGLLLGAPEAVPADSSTIAAMVPGDGPGAGLIYPISATERPQ